MHAFCEKLKQNRDRVGNLLCVGLDPDLSKIPDMYPCTVEGVFQFLDAVVQATLPYCIAYKPNVSFFEALGIDGLRCLERLCKRIPNSHPVIVDGKRGDIGNTSAMQARFMFEYLGADATTLHPYMGEDSLTPFFAYQDKYHFVLALTSNPGAATFEKQVMASGEPLFLTVFRQISAWHRQFENVGAVVGATQIEANALRSLDSEVLFLVPGVGAQGASYVQSCEATLNASGLSLINVGRTLLYGPDHQHLDQDIKKAIAQLTAQ